MVLQAKGYKGLIRTIGYQPSGIGFMEGVNMKKSKGALRIAAAVACLCGCIVWFGSGTNAAEKTYEIRPEDTLGSYRTDSARVMDAYERLMDRYMSLVEGKLTNMGTDAGHVVRKLNSIENKIDNLATRIARIEKALNIPQPKQAAKKTGQRKQPKAAPKTDKTE
jgi:hypothetical protein